MNGAIICLLLDAFLWLACPAAAAPVPVRFVEGVVHGFLLLQTTEGTVIASGDLLQSGSNGEVTSHTVFRFKDGSVFDETVVFTQKREFTMQSYRLMQKGPMFAEEMEVSLERSSGRYRIKSRKQKDGKEKVLAGSLDLPLDVYNGMIPIIAKNVRGGGIIHMVTFRPAPKVVELELATSGQHKVLVGGTERSAEHYVLKPKLGAGLKVLAKVAGKMPPDNHLWVLTADVPAFVKFQGQLYFDGPVWQIVLTCPHWPD